tara:strand:- start:437 stop:616 length:180 start_codon:yes stop_codon:yes gene_type:complete
MAKHLVALFQLIPALLGPEIGTKPISKWLIVQLHERAGNGTGKTDTRLASPPVNRLWLF